MKLRTKMFCCITIFFSIFFLLGGYTLLSYFYETAMEREMDNAAEQYQYNKFVIQSALLTKGENWLKGIANGEYDADSIASDMGNTVAFYTLDGKQLYSEFPRGTDISELLSETQTDKVNYQFWDINERKYILTAGIVAEDEVKIYLITGVDVQKVLDQQELMLQKFGIVYVGAIVISMFLIFGLSTLLTRPIKQLAEVTKSIAGGNYGERIEITGTDEVGQLAGDFNQMAAAVEEKVQELICNVRQQEDFVANFAHELKTPLTSIIGYSNRIYQKELSREEQKQAALYIWNEGMRLESLSHKLMDLTNLENGEFALQSVRADLLLQELVGGLAYLLEERHAEVTLSVECAEVKVEYDLFKTMFLNLIDNALKAGADQIQITGSLKSEKGETNYSIQVEDNGTGIPEEELNRVKEAFYMVDKSRSRKQHGAGLGLALAEKIANIHGSGLSLESEQAIGTKVTIKLCCGEGDRNE